MTAYYYVHFLDTATGTSVVYEENTFPWEEHHEYMWEDGNYSCDCNRLSFMYGGNYPCGDDRVIIEKIVLADGREVYSES